MSFQPSNLDLGGLPKTPSVRNEAFFASPSVHGALRRPLLYSFSVISLKPPPLPLPVATGITPGRQLLGSKFGRTDIRALCIFFLFYHSLLLLAAVTLADLMPELVWWLLLGPDPVLALPSRSSSRWREFASCQNQAEQEAFSLTEQTGYSHQSNSLEL